MIIHAMNTPLQGVAPLTHTGLIRAQGTDAAKFLHNQLTNDFSLLGLSEARLAGFCNAKGGPGPPLHQRLAKERFNR